MSTDPLTGAKYQPGPLCPRCKVETVRRDGAYGSFFGCPNHPDCSMVAKVRHDGSAGEWTDQPTRDWRKQAHAIFDELWKSNRLTREGAYAWMQKAMHLPAPLAHISKFNIDQCRKVIGLVKLGVGLPPAPAQDGGSHAKAE